MRIVTNILVLLLVLALGGGTYFYLFVHRPLAQDLAVMRTAQPGMEHALRRYQEQERQVRDRTVPFAGMLQNALAAEIAAGTAEVLVGGGQIVIHIAEDKLYTPQSVTFAKDSRQFQLLLAGLLKEFTEGQIIVGNTTQAAPAQGRGRLRVPAKDARTLASARSHELVKSLIKNGVADDRLVEAAFSGHMPERGQRITGSKTIIVLSTPAAVAPLASAPASPASAPSRTGAPTPQT